MKECVSWCIVENNLGGVQGSAVDEERLGFGFGEVEEGAHFHNTQKARLPRTIVHKRSATSL
jgi:hypothetical protein